MEKNSVPVKYLVSKLGKNVFKILQVKNSPDGKYIVFLFVVFVFLFV